MSEEIKALEAKIRQMQDKLEHLKKNQESSYGCASVGESTQWDAMYTLRITYNNRRSTRKGCIYLGNSVNECIDAIPDIVADLNGLYDKVKGVNG